MSTEKTKFTPGPWKWVGTMKSPQSKAYLQNEEYEQVSVILQGKEPSPEDAALIAASPELYGAIDAIMALIQGEYDDTNLMAYGPLSTDTESDILRIAEAALKKATTVS